jgi:hypothetical protein
MYSSTETIIIRKKWLYLKADVKAAVREWDEKF